MKRPSSPPNFSKCIANLQPGRLVEIIVADQDSQASQEYLHWDKLQYKEPPGNLTHEEWWLALKFKRQSLYQTIPLLDKQGASFKYASLAKIQEYLHEIDFSAGGKIGVPHEVANPETKDQYYYSSLVEEAITSSQLEGAAVTRDVAKAMIREQRQPRDRSEQMILNNFQTMQHIGTLKDQPLTQKLVFEIQKLVTEGTLEDASAAGRFRRSSENIVVGNKLDDDDVYHAPPRADELATRMQAMCDFANGETPVNFVHPVLRAIVLHFWLAYDHPFADGNGRTARALFYWSMLRSQYWLCEFISISNIILKSPAQYYNAYLYTETDDNDLTYFILYQVNVINKALESLNEYVQRTTAKRRALEREVRNVTLLNHRQRELISHALRHPNTLYSTQGHQLSHGVSNQTARNDLFNLAERCLLDIQKSGRTFYFRAPIDLDERLKTLS